MHSNVTNVAKNPFFPYFVIHGQQTSLEKIWRRMHTPATSKKLSELPISHHILLVLQVLVRSMVALFGRTHQKRPLLTQLQINEQAYKNRCTYL